RLIVRMRGGAGSSGLVIAMSNGVDGSARGSQSSCGKRPIGLLLDNPRAGRKVDRLLEPRALVIEPVDRARERDEGLAEIRARLAIADGILHVPELCVHPFELGTKLVEHGALDVAQPDSAQRLEFVHNVLKLARVFDALGFFFEDRVLVHQPADREGHQDVLWQEVAGSAHAFSSTLPAVSAAYRTIPPGMPTPRT